MKGIVYVGLLVLLASCALSSPNNDHLKVYNDVLSQLMEDNYYRHCIVFNEKSNRARNAFIDGRMDSNSYMRIIDSLKSVRKSTLPRCVLDYSMVFQISSNSKDHSLESDALRSIKENLGDDLFLEYFPNTSTNVIIETLSKPAQLDSRDLSVSYLEIVPYVKTPYRLFGNGIGVIGFSGIYFGEKSGRAILYYEFACGPKCGNGEILFLERKGENWMIVKSKRIWVS